MPLSRPNPTITDYVDHLRLMRAWLQPLEHWLQFADDYPASIPPRIFQTSLIDADLAEAGLWPEAETSDPEVHRWPVARACVLPMGGALRDRRVETRRRSALSPPVIRTASPHAPVSARWRWRFSAQWPTFLRELRTRVQTPSDVEQACQGACDSFDALLALRPWNRCAAIGSEHS